MVEVYKTKDLYSDTMQIFNQKRKHDAEAFGEWMKEYFQLQTVQLKRTSLNYKRFLETTVEKPSMTN